MEYSIGKIITGHCHFYCGAYECTRIHDSPLCLSIFCEICFSIHVKDRNDSLYVGTFYFKQMGSVLDRGRNCIIGVLDSYACATWNN